MSLENNHTIHSMSGLSHSNSVLLSKDMKIKRGMYLFLFCLALIPLSRLLNNTGYGDKIKDKGINNLYMDDLKLLARNYDELEGLLKIVKEDSAMMYAWNVGEIHVQRPASSEESLLVARSFLTNSTKKVLTNTCM